MYPPRRMFRGPQEEHRTVSTETEVRIPNLEALSICIFSAISTTGFLWWGRYWKLWFPSLLFGGGVFLTMVKTQITLPGLGLGIRDVFLRESEGRVRQWVWRQLRWVMNSIILPTANRMIPPIAGTVASFFGTQEALSYWCSEMPFWADPLLGLSAGFATATAAVVYFHWNNVRNPAWPPPYWYIEGQSGGEEPPFLLEDRSAEGQTNGM